MKALNEKMKPLGPVFGPDQSALQCWLCQAIDWGQRWDYAVEFPFTGEVDTIVVCAGCFDEIESKK